MNIGLLLVAEENDILERVLAEHEKIVDCFYVLDGTEPNDESRGLCAASDKCVGYWRDADLPRPPYPVGTVCGYRGFIYDRAREHIGWDNWFLELHGDEVWTFDPQDVVDENPGADGFIFPLPFYFPRADEPWDDTVHPLDQLRWHMLPGWPEFRMFRGGPDVRFDPNQHFNTQPHGLQSVVKVDHPIKHYPYRSPQAQHAKAELHEKTGFDPANYQHIVNNDEVYWTDAMIENAKCPQHTTVGCDA